MYKASHKLLTVAVLLLGLTACSSDDDDAQDDASLELSDEAMTPDTSGEPGGDTSRIAGLWDGSQSDGEVTDVVYWDLAANGVLTRFDFQQDGVVGATGENCYLTGDPLTVTPEADDDYTIANVAVSAVRADPLLTITFLEPDVNDLDADGDTSEIPTFVWTLLTSLVVEDLNSCISDGENSAVQQTGDETDSDIVVAGEDEFPSGGNADRPLLTRDQCQASGGTIFGDIGDGATSSPDFLCPSGLAPTANIMFLEGEPIGTDGEVCCPG